ncbi:hypothetical protein C8R47DRAFT_1102517 [Mycena vitilis]|nr:hypothetical protein C8R47DRAFT_1102517 [Mycena vitilis]
MRRFFTSTSASASASKSRFTAIALHPVPAQQSIQEFAARIEALADTRLALPVAQKTLLKYEIMIPNIGVGTPIQIAGAPSPSVQPVVLELLESQTAEDFQTFLKDEKVAQSMSTSQVAGPPIFSTDVVTRIDDDSRNKTSADVVTYVVILKCPSHESAAQFYERIESESNRLVEVLFMKSNLLTHTTLMGNSVLAESVSGQGNSVSQHVAVIKWQMSSERFHEAFADSGVKQFSADLPESAFDSVLAHRFTMDLLMKLDRETL